MKKRIWELDAFRGLCILGMVVVHLFVDLYEIYGIVDGKLPGWFNFIRIWGSLLFFLLSGTCATLGKRCVKRGLIVFGGGMACTLVTVGLYHLGLFPKSMSIYFGVLHCLGSCMLLWALCKKLPNWLLAILAVAIIAGGIYLQDVVLVDYPWLVPLGFTYEGFATSDYFPLLPNLGYFLLGAVFGRVVYKNKESLLPKANLKNPILATLLFVGKHSLLIYLLHQPVLSGLCMLLGG